MSLNYRLLAVAAGALFWASGAQAQVQTPGWFGQIEGLYASTRNGDPINSGNVGATVPGDGSGISGRLGHRFNGPWDVAVGFYYASLRDGPHIGPPPANEFSVKAARILSIDGELGRTFSGSWGGLRPFVGVRFLQVRHEIGYHPDVPLNCCFNNTTAQGFGPRIGFDGSLVLTGPISLIGGLDFALIFGDVTDVGGPSVRSGTVNRTMYTVGSRIGLDWEIMPLVHLAAGYRMEFTNGTFFTADGFNPVLSGSGDRIIQGPFVRVSYNFGGVPR